MKTIQYAVLFVSIFASGFLNETHAQSGFDSSYLFEGTLLDESTQYDLTLTGTDSYLPRDTGQVFALIGESYLDVPLALGASILTEESLYISVDFMMPNEGIDESARILFGNKDWSYDTPGFQFQLINEKTAWQPEGVAYINFNIGGGPDGTEIAGRFYDIPMGEWHTATFLVDFTTEMVTFGYNGRSFRQSLRENINGGVFNPEPFFQSLTTHSIRIGAPKAPDGSQTIEWPAFERTATDIIAELHLDNLRIASPRPAGSANAINSTLSQFTGHLNGTTPLDDADLELLYSELRNNLSGISFSDIEASSRVFIAAHNASLEPLYIPEEGARRYENFPAYSRAYLDLGLWLMRDGLTTESAMLAEGIVFQEHIEFPGAVSNAAERVEGGMAAVNVKYVKDPYYTMGDMQTNEANELSSYVYRPTGFWAPAGEAVRITVPPGVVDSGLHIRVGAHKYDHTLFVNTNRYPLIKVDYRVESENFEVINPMGGGIYVLVPQGMDIGWVNIQIDGAVRSPYYSMRSGHETSSLEWQTIRHYPAPLADFESDQYMFTVPSSAIRDFDTPDEVLRKWNEALDVIQMIHGRPLPRSRSEAFMFDTRTSVEGSYPGGYPVTPGLWSQTNGDIKQGAFSPFGMVNQGIWETNEELSVLFHEMSHHHFGYSLPMERETWVNVPFAAVLNLVLGEDLDNSLKYSTYQKFNRNDAAIDWMVTANFRNGDAIGVDPTTDFQPLELAYQSRGSAKYIDLADIFNGWEALGSIYQSFYDEDVATGTPVTYTSQPEVTRDHFLQNGSDVLGCNLSSLFHFWGIHASDALASQLSFLPPCAGAQERIEQYLRVAPRTNDDLRAFHAEKTAIDLNQLKPQIYELLLPSFDLEEGQAIRDVGAQILATYFEVEAGEPPSAPVLSDTEFSLSGNPSDLVSFSWTPSVDPEGDELTYSWRLFDSESGETLVSRSWVAELKVDIELSELTTALAAYSTAPDWVSLSQEVTTSDLFTIVTSEPLVSYFLNGIGTDTEKVAIPSEFKLEDAYPNPFSRMTTIGFSVPTTLPVSISVFDMLGRKVALLLDGEVRSAGRHQIQFDASDLGSGIYVVQMQAKGYIETKTIVLIN